MEPIVIVDYDPQWPALFAEIAGRVRAAFAGGPLVTVEHVGSTAVPGLAAKPIIDMDVIVPSQEDVPKAIARLATLGYVHQGDLGIAGREAFRSPADAPAHHLYVCACDNAEYRRHVAFRDYLRSHPQEAQQYADLKRDLAKRFWEDRTAYSVAKTEFVEKLLAKPHIREMGPIEVMDYDPQWPYLFLAETEGLRQAFGAALIRVEHIGSTSVPGLAARPVIDIQAVVQSVSEAQKMVLCSAALGWERGVFARDPEQRLFFKKYHANGVLSHHLHVYDANHPAAADHTLFRDILRRDPNEANRYLDLKKGLAHQFRHHRIAYSHAKTEYVETVLKKAGKKMDEIALTDYDPCWPEQFAEEAARIRVALGSDLVMAVEHFGSTSVPGLRAKPVLDLLVGVRSVREAREKAVAALETLGYAFWYDNPNPDHLFFVKGLPPNGPRTHHIHMIEPTLPDPKNAGFLFWDRLQFRDYLCAHPDEARRYEDLKRDLAARFPDDREAYTDGKTEYVYGLMQKVRREKE